ncbi:Uncharacterized protein dnm_069280 [Desulfonema magnum]|uniref:Uncharacterized protein n=1 Tax=Desulfonema magnum TaxID=45655 RepID=A0A975GRB6_9BACT|nr:Uncharacterized protein dnm_069280 [Desulfonema magnum]
MNHGFTRITRISQIKKSVQSVQSEQIRGSEFCIKINIIIKTED